MGVMDDPFGPGVSTHSLHGSFLCPWCPHLMNGVMVVPTC